MSCSRDPFLKQKTKSIRQSETISFILILQELSELKELSLLLCVFSNLKLRVTASSFVPNKANKYN